MYSWLLESRDLNSSHQNVEYSSFIISFNHMEVCVKDDSRKDDEENKVIK